MEVSLSKSEIYALINKVVITEYKLACIKSQYDLNSIGSWSTWSNVFGSTWYWKDCISREWSEKELWTLYKRIK